MRQWYIHAARVNYARAAHTIDAPWNNITLHHLRMRRKRKMYSQNIVTLNNSDLKVHNCLTLSMKSVTILEGYSLKFLNG